MKNFLLPKIVVPMASLLAASAHASVSHEPMCWSGERDCRAVEVSVDPSELACRPATTPSVNELARRWGTTFGVPPSWITAISTVESGGNPSARNQSGATGVMQVKIGRARDIVRWITRSAWRADREIAGVLSRSWRGLRDDLHHAELSVMLAAFDLRRLIDKFGRDLDLVAAAYAQGEWRVERCLREGLPLPSRAIEYLRRLDVVRKRNAAYRS